MPYSQGASENLQHHVAEASALYVGVEHRLTRLETYLKVLFWEIQVMVIIGTGVIVALVTKVL